MENPVMREKMMDYITKMMGSNPEMEKKMENPVMEKKMEKKENKYYKPDILAQKTNLLTF